MRSWIEEAKKKIISFTATIAEHAPDMKLNLSFVGYRDFEDAKRFESCDFTTDVSKFESFLASIQCILTC